MTLGRKVFIPNVAFHNYDDAKRFGELIGMTRGGIDSMDLGTIKDLLEGKLRDNGFHPKDFVLISGAPLINVLVVGMFLDYFGAVRLLQWDGILKEYNEFPLSITRVLE